MRRPTKSWFHKEKHGDLKFKGNYIYLSPSREFQVESVKGSIVYNFASPQVAKRQGWACK